MIMGNISSIYIAVTKIGLSLVLFSSMAVMFSVEVSAQNNIQNRAVDYRDVNNRLNHIDNQIQTLSHAVFKGGIVQEKKTEDYKSQTVQFGGRGDVGQVNPADIEIRLSQLEREIRALTGRIETQAHRQAKAEDAMQRKLSDLELRIQDIESGKAGANLLPDRAVPQELRKNSAKNDNSNDAPLAGLTQPREAAPSQSLGILNGRALPIDMYETAFAKLKNGRYAEAEKSFRAFITQHPDHHLISNARYWLGETFYVRKDYEQAARAFARGYKENPSGAKAPDNLLKLGLSLDGLENRDDACVALIQLTQKFPDGPRPVLNRAEQEIERLRCAQ